LRDRIEVHHLDEPGILKVRHRGSLRPDDHSPLFRHSDIKRMVQKERGIAVAFYFKIFRHSIDIVNLSRTDFFKKPDSQKISEILRGVSGKSYIFIQ